MIEHLADHYTDSDGWIATLNPNIKGVVAAVADALDLKLDLPQLSYSSLLGIPITRGGSSKQAATNASSDSTEAKIDHIKEDLFGPDIVSTQSLFTFQTSYVYANCSVGKAVAKPSVVNYGTVVNASKTSWGAGVGETVTNGNGLTIAYER